MFISENVNTLNDCKSIKNFKNTWKKTTGNNNISLHTFFENYIIYEKYCGNAKDTSIYIYR